MRNSLVGRKSDGERRLQVSKALNTALIEPLQSLTSLLGRKSRTASAQIIMPISSEDNNASLSLTLHSGSINALLQLY